MSSQAYEDPDSTFIEQQITPISTATKRLFLPSSSPLSSLFGSKCAKLALREAGSPLKSQTANCNIPVAETEELMECIFAGVDHSEEDCSGECFRIPIMESNDNAEADAELAKCLFGAAGDEDAQIKSGEVAKNSAVSLDSICSPAKVLGESREVIYISSDPPAADKDVSDVWSMHTATLESMETDRVGNIAPDIMHVFFHRGDDRRIGEDDYPTVIYINRDNGKVYQSVVDHTLFFIKHDLSGFEDRSLWLQTNIYIGGLMDKCVEETSDPVEAFPILHRHGNHLSITSQELAEEADARSDLRASIRREWSRLIARYGDFNDNQNEQRGLVDKAFYLLGSYQRAVASRDLVDLMKINGLLLPLRDALNELALNEYVIRELFYRDTNPQFVSAISMI